MTLYLRVKAGPDAELYGSRARDQHGLDHVVTA
jgi:hypothetical protein